MMKVKIRVSFQRGEVEEQPWCQDVGWSAGPDLQPAAVATVTAVRVTDHGAAIVFQLPWGNKILIRRLLILESTGLIKLRMFCEPFVY